MTSRQIQRSLFLGIFLVAGFFLSKEVSAASFYLSPSGNNANAGTSESTPWKTFAKAFSSMSGGDELILLDGTYSEANGTGYISNTGTGSGQPPSGLSVSSPTYVYAKNPGNVKIIGRMILGTSSIKRSYIKIQGITFEGGGGLYNTSYVTVKECGFYQPVQSASSVFGIGTIDHNNGNSYNLIEDVWVWGNTRVIAINYRADYNVWRRVVVRGDGCSVSGCTGSGNPNVGITSYNSDHTVMENIVVLDRIVIDSASQYADFATAQHIPGQNDQGVGEYLGPNSWLGCLSLNSPDAGYYFEADNANDNTITLKNSVSWNSALSGFNMGTATLQNILLENLTSGEAGSQGIRLAPGVTGTLRSVIAYSAATYGINSAVQPSYSDVYGSGTSAYNQTTCSTGCKTTNPLADGTPASLKYITRIESGSALKGTGYGGGDYGANIIYRYGVDGTRYDDTNYNTLTSNLLWPYPNEARIKKELCDDTGVTRGFCSDSSLTHYIMNQLGNGDPYSGSTPVFSACSTVTTSNFSQSAYNAYGAPFDAFQTGTNLIDAKCNSADTHTVQLTTGVTGDTTRIVYTKGYWYDSVTTAWRQYTGTCTGALNGEWCQGSVSATITDPNVSTASSTNPTYLVGMTCSVQGGSWKCGCRDTACSNFSWQIQGAGL